MGIFSPGNFLGTAGMIRQKYDVITGVNYSRADTERFTHRRCKKYVESPGVNSVDNLPLREKFPNCDPDIKRRKTEFSSEFLKKPQHFIKGRYHVY